MASRLSNEPHGRPEPGQILIVIHDFSARSSDELSLSKGDRVELIERDDDFGDGWYLGRHLQNLNSGLFPEVYTRIAPRGPPSYPPAASPFTRTYPTALGPSNGQVLSQPTASVTQNIPMPGVSAPAIEVDRPAQISHQTLDLEEPEESTLTSPLNAAISSQVIDAPLPIATPPEIPMQPKSLTTTIKSAHTHGQDSPVMNETLSVIEEHITDMNFPHNSAVSSSRQGGNDSGSEYSSHIDQRLSYINGEETDEEEERLHTREEVESWTPDQVAEYLFTAGVESKHCEVFRDQEITGDVLLGMDQTSVFLKEFDLGSVGRRLKTWQKIKLIQDEANGESSTRRNTGTYGSEVGSDVSHQHRSRSTNSSSVLHRIPSVNERPGSLKHNSRLSQQQTLRANSLQGSSISPISPMTMHDTSRPVGDRRRPSAASIRDLHHSRQSSANEFATASLIGALADPLAASSNSAHKKQPSFDKNWTMNSAASPSLPGRPLSSSGLKMLGESSTDTLAQSTNTSINTDLLDRGYFSGGEVEGKQRNVLRKRGSTATHSRNSSYTDEQRLRSATAHSRHSRFGSVDSINPGPPPSAAQKYYGLTVNGRRRTPSEASINAPSRPAPPPKDIPSPTVTKLEGNNSTMPKSPRGRPSKGTDWLLPVKPIGGRSFGLRAISDAVTGHEKSRVTLPSTETDLTSPMKESPTQSPSRAGSSTPSAGPSFELDSPDAKSASTMGTLMSTQSSTKANRKKSKKETSAYTRGLEKKTPQEQMVDADYSGWMKKKSTNLMTTWKPRLFVLKGRRLSYYYSETDEQEKGLIDISFHRVLPADNERLTGLHAHLTGAMNSPTSPAGATAATMAATDAAAEPESTLSKGSGDSVFIFKLVPPRAGLTKAVTFTKPTVHYFAVPNIKQGRLWMAALMKATIDRDDSKAITTTYQQKTISLAKARAMRHRPPALMNLDEHVDEEAMKTPASDKAGLNIQGIIYDRETQEEDSGVSGISKSRAPPESINSDNPRTA